MSESHSPQFKDGVGCYQLPLGHWQHDADDPDGPVLHLEIHNMEHRNA